MKAVTHEIRTSYQLTKKYRLLPGFIINGEHQSRATNARQYVR